MDSNDIKKDSIDIKKVLKKFERNLNVLNGISVKNILYSSYHNFLEIKSPKKIKATIIKIVNGSRIEMNLNEKRINEDNYEYSICLSDPEMLNLKYNLGLKRRCNFPRDVEFILYKGNDTFEDYKNCNADYDLFNTVTKITDDGIDYFINIKNTIYHPIYEIVSENEKYKNDINLDNDEDMKVSDLIYILNLYNKMYNVVPLDQFYERYKKCLGSMAKNSVKLFIQQGDDDTEDFDVKIKLSYNKEYPESKTIKNLYSETVFEN